MHKITRDEEGNVVFKKVPLYVLCEHKDGREFVLPFDEEEIEAARVLADFFHVFGSAELGPIPTFLDFVLVNLPTEELEKTIYDRGVPVEDVGWEAE